VRLDRCHHALAGVVLLIAAVATCRAEAPPAAPVLRVGTSGDYNPFSFHDGNGILTGFDISVAERLAGDLGRAVVFSPLQWRELVPQLRAGAFDIAMSGVTVRADRAVYLAFTRPYIVTGAVAVIRVGDRKRFRTLAALDHTGRRIAVNAGGHLEQVARQRFPHARVVAVLDNASLPGVLLRGEADAVISEALEASTWPAAQFCSLGPFTHDRKAYAVLRESTALLRQVNEWLAAREADGWLDQQRRHWFGERAMLSPQQADLEALVGAMDLRLQLMPLVAAAKRHAHLPVEDPAQETRVLDRVRTAAAAAGLNREGVAALFQVQMDAAKAVERRADGTHAEPTAASQGEFSLADLRAAVATVSDQIITALARCQAWLHEPGGQAALTAAARNGLTTPGLTPELAARLADALCNVHRQAQ
jgi:cyclohexadienyl dehydratase